MIEALLTFAVFSFLLTIAPGPDSVLILRNLLSSGRGAGMWTAAGACSGSLVWGSAAALGLAALLLQSAAAYEVVRIAGAAYLILLGLSTLRARKRALAQATEGLEKRHQDLSRWRAFRSGLLSDLLNPKVGLFFLAVIPQFLPAGHSAATATLLFAAVDVLIALAWFAFFVLAAHQIVHLLRRPRVHRVLERVAGCVLVGFGVTLIADRH